MIYTAQLLYKLDMRLNKLATNEHQNIPTENKLFALNEAQIQLIKKKIDPNNIYGLGFDSFRKRYEDLQTIVVQDEKVVKLNKENISYDAYSFSVKDLKNQYMFPIGVIGVCSRGECKNRQVVADKINKHSDIPTLMVNTNYNPSFEYQETLCSISSDKIYIYTDGTFKVDSIFISYIRYPKKIDQAGYHDINTGLPTIDQDCELDEYLENELLDLATLELSLNTENNPAIQASDIRIKNNE